jgi:hypothetical protein
LTDAAVLTRADVEVAEAAWTPKYLDTEQNETLLSLSECIVPGSGKARVNRFIDLLLSVDTSENQKDFSRSLSAVDEEAQQRFGDAFRALSAARQHELLASILIEPAIHQEGEKPAQYVFGNLPGCVHAEEHL